MATIQRNIYVIQAWSNQAMFYSSGCLQLSWRWQTIKSVPRGGRTPPALPLPEAVKKTMLTRVPTKCPSSHCARKSAESQVLLEQEGGLIHYTVTQGLSFFRSCWHQMLCGLFSAQRGVQSWALYNTHSSSQFAVATDNRKCHQFHKQKSL